MLKTSGKLLSLIKVPESIKSAFPKHSLSEEEKIYDKDGDEELNKQETKAKLIGDFKIQFEKTVLGKFDLTTDELIAFKNADKKDRDALLKKYIEENPKYQSISGSVDTKVKLYSSLIDKQLNAGKELFDLIKTNERIYVSGIVVDDVTGEPVKGAKVEFSSPNFESINAFKDTTDRKGKFTIEIPSASFNDPLSELTPEEIEQGNKGTNLLFVNPSLLPTQSSNVVLPTNNFPFNININPQSDNSIPTTNNPKLISFSGSIYLPVPYSDEPDDPVIQTTLELTGSATTTTPTGSTTTAGTTTSGTTTTTSPTPPNTTTVLEATPNPITQPDLSGYTLYVAKDENGTPSYPLYSGNTDSSGSFNFSLPETSEFISISKGSGTNLVIYTTINTAELNLEEVSSIEIPNLQSNDETLSNTTVETANTSTSTLANDIIIIKATNYTMGNISPYKGNGNVKDKVIVKLTSLAKILEVEKINALLPNPAAIQEITKDKKDAKWYQNEKLAKVSRELTSTMLPVVLTMAASFGVGELEKALQKGKTNLLNQVSCPTTPEGNLAKDEILKINNEELSKYLNINPIQ
jgi:hypothetical protein